MISLAETSDSGFCTTVTRAEQAEARFYGASEQKNANSDLNIAFVITPKFNVITFERLTCPFGCVFLWFHTAICVGCAPDGSDFRLTSPQMTPDV